MNGLHKALYLTCAAILLAQAVGALPATQSALDAQTYGSGIIGASSTYPVGFNQSTATGTWSVKIDSPRYDTRSSLTASNWTMQFTASYLTAETSAGTWSWQVSVDSVNVPNCAWQITTYNAAIGVFATVVDSSYNVVLTCVWDAPAYGSHFVNVTQSTASGTPSAILGASSNVYVQRTDWTILGDNAILANSTATQTAITGLNATDGTRYTGLLANFTSGLAGVNATLATDYAGILANLTTGLANLNASDQQRYLNVLQILGDFNFTGNLTLIISNGTLANIWATANATLANTTAVRADLSAHRAGSLEVNAMSFQGLGFDGFLILILDSAILIGCMMMGWRVSAAFAIAMWPGALVSNYFFGLDKGLPLIFLGIVYEYVAHQFRLYRARKDRGSGDAS